MINRTTLTALREANLARLPEYRNSHGTLVHTQPDGSDWSPEQWFQAVIGEVGEYANLRKKFERGDFDEATFLAKASKELADVVLYIDLLAVQTGNRLDGHIVEKTAALRTPARWLQLLHIALSGCAQAQESMVWADERRVVELARLQAGTALRESLACLYALACTLGIDLERATIDKFNEVSLRIGSAIRLAPGHWYHEAPATVA